jgi:anti-sigma factor ChrR (cupin superfamily)
MRQSVIVHDVLSPDLEHLSWEPFHPGVEVSWIYREDGDYGSAAAFLRYQPGAAIPQHLHTGFENILILSGSQTDRNGRHSAGTLVINQPGTSHDVVSDEGCVVLITWQKPVVL